MRLPTPTRPTAERLLARFAARPGPLTTRVARELLEVALEGAGFASDRYGNFLLPPDRRVHFGPQTVYVQRRSAGRWSGPGEPLLAAATEALRTAAAVAQDPSALRRIEGATTRRTGDAARRADKAAQAERRRAAWRVALFELSLRDRAGVLGAFGLGPAPSPEVVASLRAQVSERATELEAPGPLPDPSARASADRPPILPLCVEDRISWEEPVGDEVFTVTVSTPRGAAGQGRAHVDVGDAGGVLLADPTSRGARFDPGRRRGGAYLSGRVEWNARLGAWVGALFLLTSRRPGSGLRAASLWCRLMAGYGVDYWVAEALSEEGERMVAMLVRRGSLELLGRDGSNLVVRCRAAGEAGR